MAHIGRREFICMLGGAAAWPLVARAQQRTLPVIGYLSSNESDESGDNGAVAAFRRGIGEQGYVEGRNVEILYRYGEYQNDRWPELAADLVRRRVAIIFVNFTPAALAAKKATATIPIVFSTGSDPVQAGLVASLNRPGGNITGMAYLVVELAAKRLELLHEIAPAAKSIGYLYRPNVPFIEEPTIDALEAAARWAAFGNDKREYPKRDRTSFRHACGRGHRRAPNPQREVPRLCRGGSSSLTFTE